MFPKASFWFWSGGTEIGKWCPAWPEEGHKKGKERVERMGYVVRLGEEPKGPPTKEEFYHVGFLLGENSGYGF